MRRFAMIFVAILCLIALVFPVSARNGAESVQSQTVVSADGSCIVDLTVTVILDGTVADPVFPVPAEASNVTLNNTHASGTVTGQAMWIPLKNITGGIPFHIRYTLPAVVSTEKEMLLTLPLLSGFAYPVDALEFTVTLPGDVPEEPEFTSSYYQENASSILKVSVDGPTVTGKASNLKDHETLTMILPVNETLFPQTAATARVLGMMDLSIAVVVLLAVVYYLLAMRPPFFRRVQRSTAPDGICAGDTGLWLTGSGVDLSLLVVTWAQLGYLRIQVDDSGRVLLHKRMEMGNERSVFENRCYKNLFGRRRIVDGTGYHYAELCRSVAKQKPRIREVYLTKSGNPYIFHGLCALAGLLSGISLAGAFSRHAIFLQVLLGILMTALSLAIQFGGLHLPRRNKLPVYVALGCCGLWLILGLCSGTLITALLMVLFQFASGVAVAYGGRRTELGQQALKQILGLRRHMRRVSRKELQRLLKVNPGYFHNLAPYALALDVDRVFARRFGRLRLQECTYLISGMNGQMTAAEWAKLLRTAVQTLDARAKRLPIEKLTNR